MIILINKFAIQLNVIIIIVRKECFIWHIFGISHLWYIKLCGTDAVDSVFSSCMSLWLTAFCHTEAPWLHLELQQRRCHERMMKLLCYSFVFYLLELFMNSPLCPRAGGLTPGCSSGTVLVVRVYKTSRNA